MDSATHQILRETLAHLVPCSGGKPVVLAKPNLYIGRRLDVDPSAPLNPQTARCRLKLVSGWWEIERIDPALEVRINNRSCEFGRVCPGDELAIGRARYRMEYEPPGSSSDFAMELLKADEKQSARPPAPSKPLSRERPAVEPGAAPAREPQFVARPSRVTSLPQRKPESSSRNGAPAAPAMLRGALAHLVPIGGGQDIPIQKPEVTVGREKDCDIALRVKTVSGIHCKLVLMDGYWRVIDLNSRNGVRVDGVPCKEAWVFPECRLAISDQRFQLDYVPVGPRPLQDAEAVDSGRSLMDKIGVNERELDRMLNRIQDQYPDEIPNKRRDLNADM